jgi:hypothetical protein
MWWRFAGKHFVTPEASLGATEGDQEEDENVMTSLEHAEWEQDDEKVNGTEHSRTI